MGFGHIERHRGAIGGVRFETTRFSGTGGNKCHFLRLTLREIVHRYHSLLWFLGVELCS